MNLPLLLVITGRPASGKSTLAQRLSKEIRLPLISRDQLKEGYIHTVDIPHSDLGPSANKHIYEAFFYTIDLLISQGVSIIAEAAFQDKLWRPKLLKLSEKANIKVIICEIEPKEAKSRFNERLLQEPERARFHGDHMLEEDNLLFTRDYQALNMEVPTLEVSTDPAYNPGIEEIIGFVKR